MPSHSSDEEDSRGNDDDGGPRWVVKSKATGKNLTRLTLKKSESKKVAVEIGEGSGTGGSRVGEASDIPSVAEDDESDEMTPMEGHFSDELWQLTLRHYDTRKYAAFEQARSFGKHCRLTLAGIVQRFVDNSGDQLAFNVMNSLYREDYGADGNVVELESGDVNVQSFGCGVVLIKER